MMVDLTFLQPISWFAASIGVCVAAVYYVMNLRETNKNRRITLATNLMQPVITKTTWSDFLELLNMQWSDFNDFKRKYDSRINPDNFAKRMSMWSYCSLVGELFREGLMDPYRYNTSYLIVRVMWWRFGRARECFQGFSVSG